MKEIRETSEVVKKKFNFKNQKERDVGGRNWRVREDNMYSLYIYISKRFGAKMELEINK